ncbi:MAG TPA: SDR family oxidoreductase [Acidimicrobiales bacterium]|jgi:NAD(P)-dependent dehydrogenase (short-subunit alcohol dehydrogenase family)|nr:SDR family oxidoreductase [Acidimicrobiales bacterium]
MSDMGRGQPGAVTPRVALVTGGGRGIGRAVALALGAAGCAVCVNDTGVALDGSGASADVAEAVADEIRAAGGEAFPAPGDARRPDGARAVMAQVEAWAGRAPTVLVHAAGTLRDAMAHRASDEDWAEVLGSHLGVAIEFSRAMVGPIRATGWGRIVYLGGAAGLVGSAGQAAYDVAKAGLLGLTRALALELAGRDVCVNYVAPFAFTRMTESIPPATGALRRYLDHAPLATPGDVAPLVAWLCSDEAAGISGQVFGARGAEVSVWSQPRPVAAVVETRGWDGPALARAREDLQSHFTPLESEFDLFGGPPVAVAPAMREVPE